jgi:hypothetical protein
METAPPNHPPAHEDPHEDVSALQPLTLPVTDHRLATLERQWFLRRPRQPGTNVLKALRHRPPKALRVRRDPPSQDDAPWSLQMLR